MKRKTKRSLRRPAAACVLLALLFSLTGNALALQSGGDAETAGIDTITVGTPEELLALAKNCALDTWSKDKKVVLSGDISLSNVDFTTIPVFGGTFDGGGYTVSGLSLTGSFYPTGLFGIVEEGAVIQNLNVKGAVSPSGDAEAVGGIAGINNGVLSACSFTGTVNGESSVGGIAGINGLTGTVLGCKVSGGVFGQHAVGGIAGSNLGVINKCAGAAYVNTNSVDPSFAPEELEVNLTESVARFASTDSLNTSTDVGGIAGYSSGAIENSANSGVVGYRHIGYNIGGVVGRSCGYLAGCRNTGAVYGRKDVGGIAGQMEPYISANLSQNLLSELQEEIKTLHGQINKAILDTDDTTQTASSRLNKMADYMEAAADAVGHLSAYASIVSSVTGSASGSASASGEGSAPSVSISGDSGSGISISGDPISAAGESAASGQGSVSATSQIKVNASQGKLSAALSGMTNQLRLLNGEMSGASGVLSEDLRAINDQADAIADTAVALFTAVETADTDSLLTDASDVNAEEVTLGKAVACRNDSPVYGDIDVGGIAGSLAIEYELDPEDDVSSRLSSGVQSSYELKAVIQSCQNSGEITAKRDCAGGICGRMDLGLILNARGYGSVKSENGDYAGGIAGLSSSVIRGCFTKCTLSGRSYVGGVIGSGCAGDGDRAGSVTEKCCSLVTIAECSQFGGAVSGCDGGEFTDNYFVSDTLAGLGMASYTGRAEPLAYSELTGNALLPAAFRSFTLRFTADGVTIDSLTFRYGDSFDASVFPEIPEKEGYYAVWDTQTLTDLRFDTVVTAVYTPYVSALESEELRANGRPILFAEGAFCGDDALTLSAKAQTPGEFSELSQSFGEAVEKYFACLKSGELPLPYVCREIVEQWAIELPADGQSAHTLRYLSPSQNASNLQVFYKQEGKWIKVSSKALGSYLTFTVPSNDPEIAVLSTMPVWWIYLAVGALLLLLFLLLLRAVKKSKRRKKAEKPEAAAPEGGEIPLSKKRTRRKKVRGFLIVLILLVCAAAGALLFLHSDRGAGIRALRLLRAFSRQESLSMNLTVNARVDGQPFSGEASIDRVTVSGRRFSCIAQGGVTLYYADDAVYFENGRGYKASGLFPDYANLLTNAADLYENAKISYATEGDTKVYSVFATGEQAKSLLSLLLPAYGEQLSSVNTLTIDLLAVNGAVTELRFAGDGVLSGGAPFTVDAALTVITPLRSPAVPQAVIDAALLGSAEDTELGETVFRLLQALSALNKQDPLCADIRLTANCGPLLLDAELRYFKTAAEGREVSCLYKDGLAVYFTADGCCLSDGSNAPEASISDTECASLLSIAYRAFINGNPGCEEREGAYVYSLSLSKEEMQAAANAIAPSAKSMDLALKEGSVTLTVENGAVSAVAFALLGSTKIVLTETSVSFGAELTFTEPEANEDCTVPDAVLNTLIK